MNASTTDSARAETVFGITEVLTATGVIMFALFPLAIPFVLLLTVAALPLALLGIPVLILAAAVLAMRAIGRAVRPRRRTGPSPAHLGASPQRGPTSTV
jgi:hypothetical protein